MKKKKKDRAKEGTANVFADLDLLHAEQELLRARLTLQIYKVISARELTPPAVASCVAARVTVRRVIGLG